MTRIFLFFIAATLLSGTGKAQKNPDWVFRTQGRVYSTPVIDGSVIYFGSGDHNFYALEKKSGQEIWKFPTGGEIHSSPAIHNDLVIFGSADGNLYALDKTTGRKVWHFESEGENIQDLWDYYLSSPATGNDIVYWGSGDGHVYAVDARSGKLKWKYQTGGIVHAEPLVVDENVFIGNYAGDFFALHAETGAVLWQFKTVGHRGFPNGEVQKGASFDNGTLYFGSRDFNVYAINAQTGRGHWNMKEQGSWVIATPLVYKDNIYFGTSDTHRFYGMNKSSGQIVWQIPLPMRVYGSAVAYNDVIYFGCFDGILRGVDPATGDIVWTYQTPASKNNYTRIFDEKGSFKEGFELYGKDYEKAERSIHSLGSILSTPVVDDNSIFFGSSDGCLYSVNLEK